MEQNFEPPEKAACRICTPEESAYLEKRTTESADTFIQELLAKVEEVNACGCDECFEDIALKTYHDAYELLMRKHADYGPKNISQSPGGALVGLRVRMWDKLARINHLLDTGTDPKNESLQDSFRDLANYALIGVLVLDGNWPE